MTWSRWTAQISRQRVLSESERTMEQSRMFHDRGFTAPYASALLALALMLSPWTSTRADEGGVPFWFSGQYASLAAVPATPGWSLPMQGYYYNGDASPISRFTAATASRSGSIRACRCSSSADVRARHETARRPVAVGVGFGYGKNTTKPTSQCLRAAPSSIERLRVGLHRPLPGREPRMVERRPQLDDLPHRRHPGRGLQQQAALQHRHRSRRDRRGRRVHLPQPAERAEFSAVLGFTYNFENTSTNYKNGIDSHLDWAVSQFLSANWEVGVVGYVYYQLTGDSGTGAKLGAFKSKVASIGPEVGYAFTMAGCRRMRTAWLLGVLGGEPAPGLCGVRDAGNPARTAEVQGRLAVNAGKSGPMWGIRRSGTVDERLFRKSRLAGSGR